MIKIIFDPSLTTFNLKRPKPLTIDNIVKGA